MSNKSQRTIRFNTTEGRIGQINATFRYSGIAVEGSGEKKGEIILGTIGRHIRTMQTSGTVNRGSQRGSPV